MNYVINRLLHQYFDNFMSTNLTAEKNILTIFKLFEQKIR